VLAREAQEAGQLRQGVQQARDRGGVAGAPAGGERLGAAVGFGQRRRTGLGLDVVEDLSVVGLGRVLVSLAHLGQDVAGAVKP
jgi:hypothetical protein